MTDADFIKFAEDMDRCWQEGRFHDLETFLADDVVIVAPDGKTRLEGLAAAVESYREFTASSLVEHYITSGYIVTHRGDTAVIEYQWEMAWTSAGVDYNDTGREVLVLASRGDAWRVIWRMQIPTMR
jgi:hypothetical protein